MPEKEENIFDRIREEAREKQKTIAERAKELEKRFNDKLDQRFNQSDNLLIRMRKQ